MLELKDGTGVLFCVNTSVLKICNFSLVMCILFNIKSIIFKGKIMIVLIVINIRQVQKNVFVQIDVKHFGYFHIIF